MGDTFVCLKDNLANPEAGESCEWWNNWEFGMCPEAEYQVTAPAGAVVRNGHAIWRVHPRRYSADALGIKLDRGPYARMRISHPLGKAGTPDGYEPPDGSTWFQLSPYVVMDDEGKLWDYWPEDIDPSGVGPEEVPDPPAHPGDVGPRCGWFVEMSNYYHRIRQWCARRDQARPRRNLEVPLQLPTSRRLMFAQPSPCMVSGLTHHLYGQHMPGSDSTDKWFHGDGNGPLNILTQLGVNLSGASFGPTRYPSIKHIKDQILQTVGGLVAPNMDRIDMYMSDSPIAQGRREGWYRRSWPVFNDPTNPPPSDPGDYPLVMQLPMGLRGARLDDGSPVSFMADLVLTAARIEAWAQFIGFVPTDSGGTNGEIRLGIVVEVSAEVDLRLHLDNWPHLASPAYIVRSYLDPDDPQYKQEVLTTWFDEGGGYSMTPGIRDSDGWAGWNIDGVRMFVIDAFGDDPTYRALPYFPTRIRWQGELGPFTVPEWPELSAELSGAGVGRSLACGLVRQLRPVSVPARHTRVNGTAAPEVYQGSVSLTFAPQYSEAMLNQYCDGQAPPDLPTGVSAAAPFGGPAPVPPVSPRPWR